VRVVRGARAETDASAARYDALSKELDTFRAVFNKRVAYYAALQEISDSVSSA
jgi:hypothetical protein